MAQAETWLLEVSPPGSSNYGKHWTQQQIIDAFAPSDEAYDTVTRWLQNNGINRFTHSDNKLWIAFDLQASKAEELLYTKYLEHQSENGAAVVDCDEYHLPRSVSDHIDFVTPGIKGSIVSGRTKRNLSSVSRADLELHRGATEKTKRAVDQLPSDLSATSLKHCDKYVTPACIRAMYNIPEVRSDEVINQNNTMGVFAPGMDTCESRHFMYSLRETDRCYRY
jgi:tripeptidyl-peptidase I